MNASGQQVTYEADVKPLFWESDRDAMVYAFDLWSYDDVSENAEVILAKFPSRSMPCDGPWPGAQVDLFAGWIDGGKSD